MHIFDALTAIFGIGKYLGRQCVSWLLITNRRTFVRCILLHEFLFRFFARFSDVNHFISDIFTVENHQDALLPLLDLLTITNCTVHSNENIHKFYFDKLICNQSIIILFINNWRSISIVFFFFFCNI